MYSPKQFEHSGHEFAHMVIAENPFAMICVANAAGSVDVVHVPTRLEPGQGELGRLQFHVAKQNGIWNLFDGSREAVAIFSGPHAYISPDWYETHGLVPTWDYVAVHATGVARLYSTRSGSNPKMVTSPAPARIGKISF